MSDTIARPRGGRIEAASKEHWTAPRGLTLNQVEVDWRAVMQPTEWRPVVGYEGFYEVSNAGQVRNTRSGRILVPAVSTGRRGLALSVVLSVAGEKRRARVHRVVADAYLPPQSGPLIRHRDGDATNNRPENLAWGTLSENALDSVRHGTNANANKEACPEGHPYDERPLVVRGKRDCRECNRLEAEARQAKGLPEADPRHGTHNGYVNYRCRCAACVTAEAAYIAAWKRNR